MPTRAVATLLGAARCNPADVAAALEFMCVNMGQRVRREHRESRGLPEHQRAVLMQMALVRHALLDGPPEALAQVLGAIASLSDAILIGNKRPRSDK
jgi:hypothetical protein